jgi:hypothetical protein
MAHASLAGARKVSLISDGMEREVTTGVSVSTYGF